MRLRTIWTMPTFTLRERVNRTQEWFWMKLAHRLPRKLALWSFIDTGTRYMGETKWYRRFATPRYCNESRYDGEQRSTTRIQ